MLVEWRHVVVHLRVPVLRQIVLQIDWRPLLPRITIPCLNLRGLKNGVFHPEGTAVVSKLVPRCDEVRSLSECIQYSLLGTCCRMQSAAAGLGC